MKDDREPPETLLDELDARQNDVLAQLEDLNHRIEQLMQEFSRRSRGDNRQPTQKAA